MPTDTRIYKVFIASPSDAQEERNELKITVDCIRWNGSPVPGVEIEMRPVLYEELGIDFGETDPQSVINKAVTSCDYMIAIFRKRVGTQTERSPSGTIEEISLYLSKFKDDKNTPNCLKVFLNSEHRQQIERELSKHISNFENRITEEYTSISDLIRKASTAIHDLLVQSVELERMRFEARGAPGPTGTEHRVAATSRSQSSDITGTSRKPQASNVKGVRDATIDSLRPQESDRTRNSSSLQLATFCLNYQEQYKRRPAAVDAWRQLGTRPNSTPIKRGGGWHNYLSGMLRLSDDQQQTAEEMGEELRKLETERITKSYKFVAMKAMLELGILHEPISVADISIRSLESIRTDFRLCSDVTNSKIPDPYSVSANIWRKFWLNMPLFHLSNKTSSLFTLEDGSCDGMMKTRFSVSEANRVPFSQMAIEIIQWRLEIYLSDHYSKTSELAR